MDNLSRAESRDCRLLISDCRLKDHSWADRSLEDLRSKICNLQLDCQEPIAGDYLPLFPDLPVFNHLGLPVHSTGGADMRLHGVAHTTESEMYGGRSLHHQMFFTLKN